MSDVRVSLVDCYVLRTGDGALDCLALRRAAGGRCPGAWEGVHGHIEAGESPAAAVVRELREETGLAPARLYNLSRVELFYRHAGDEVALVPVFAAFVAGTDVTLSAEHDAAMWLPLPAARRRLSWPRSARALDDIERIFAGGDAGPLEDVLRVS